MFKTHDSMSVPLMRAFSQQHSYWTMIERDAKTTWFYVTLRYRVEGHLISRIFMPDTVELLLQLLEDDCDSLTVQELQIVTPTKVNQSGRWLMEPLTKVELALGSDDDEVFIYTTEDDRVYVDPPQSRRFDHAIAKRTTLYSIAEAKNVLPASVTQLSPAPSKSTNK